MFDAHDKFLIIVATAMVLVLLYLEQREHINQLVALLR